MIPISKSICLIYLTGLGTCITVTAQEKSIPVNNSSIAFTVPEKNLIPENLAYNPADSSFYIGSTHQRKVIRVKPDGRHSDFIKEAQDGQWMVVGMKIDIERQILWFCSSVGDVMRGYSDGDFGKSTGIFKYDLKSGKLIKKYLLEKPDEKHFFNDLVLNKNGDVFFTDMAGNSIGMIRMARDEIEILAQPTSFTDPNGICLSADENTLFVAAEEGIFAITIANGATTLLSHEPNLKVNGIDGLYYYNNSLIAVQNGADRVIRFYLADKQDKIIHHKIIEAGHPFFSMNPTTGVVAGNVFYYIANSQFGSFDKNHKIFPSEQLYDVVILKTILE